MPDASEVFSFYAGVEFGTFKEQGNMRILVADSQPKVRQALRVLLEHQPGLEVVGEVADAADLLAQVKAVSPDIVLLHWRLRGWSAAGSLCGLREAVPDLAVIVLSGHPEVEEAALAAGADAFVSKTDPAERLLGAIVGVVREEDTTTASGATLADECPF
jgi:DNA-binding NarL/FixJ family response regulator